MTPTAPLPEPCSLAAPDDHARLLLRRWLEPRAPAMEVLRFSCIYLGNPARMLSLATILPPLATCTALARVSVLWDGPWTISVPPSGPGCRDPLLALHSLALVGCDVVIPRRSSPQWRRPPALREFMLLNGSLLGQGAEGASSLDSAWLPPTLTSLSLSNCMHAPYGVAAVPGVLAHLPRLRCLVSCPALGLCVGRPAVWCRARGHATQAGTAHLGAPPTKAHCCLLPAALTLLSHIMRRRRSTATTSI